MELVKMYTPSSRNMLHITEIGIDECPHFPSIQSSIHHFFDLAFFAAAAAAGFVSPSGFESLAPPTTLT